MIPLLLSVYTLIVFLMTLQLIEVKIDEKHSTTLLKLVVLKILGVKSMYYKNYVN